MADFKKITVKDVAMKDAIMWLICSGLEHKVERFKAARNLDLQTATVKQLVSVGLDQDHAEKLIEHIHLAKSVSRLEELTAELDAVKLEKKGLEELLVAKDEKIRQLTEDNHSRDQPSDIRQRGEVQGRDLEERQEHEPREEEISICNKPEMIICSKPETVVTSQFKQLHHPYGKKHYKEEPAEAHRYF